MKKLRNLIAGVILASCLVFTPTHAQSISDQDTTVENTIQESIHIKGKDNISIYTGKQRKLSIKEKESIVWYSENKKIVSVNKKGIIKGNKVGSTYVYAISKDNKAVSDKIKVTVKKPKYKAEDLRLLAAVVFCEAGNQSYAGKKAVAIVVLNRVKSKDFPNTVNKVIYQRGQFTCTGKFLNSSLSKYDNGKLDKESIKAAKEVLEGSRSVNIAGKTINMNNYHFFSRYVSGCRLQIDDHMFK